MSSGTSASSDGTSASDEFWNVSLERGAGSSGTSASEERGVLDLASRFCSLGLSLCWIFEKWGVVVMVLRMGDFGGGGWGNFRARIPLSERFLFCI